jgi:hypothetical protein
VATYTWTATVAKGGTNVWESGTNWLGGVSPTGDRSAHTFKIDVTSDIVPYNPGVYVVFGQWDFSVTALSAGVYTNLALKHGGTITTATGSWQLNQGINTSPVDVAAQLATDSASVNAAIANIRTGVTISPGTLPGVLTVTGVGLAWNPANP